MARRHCDRPGHSAARQRPPSEEDDQEPVTTQAPASADHPASGPGRGHRHRDRLWTSPARPPPPDTEEAGYHVSRPPQRPQEQPPPP